MNADEGELLGRFAEAGDADAFGELVRRHGPPVLGACRRILGHDHDAEDAFQAAFMVLARKARGLDRSRPLGPWLHGVALRIALDLRSTAKSRKKRERKLARLRREESPPKEREEEIRALLDEEIRRLPDRYRSPFILCFLEGRSGDEAARALGWPRGTVSTRLGRAREILRKRLAARGLVVTGTLLGAIAAPAAVPAALAAATVVAAGNGAVLSPSVAMLVHGGIKAMTAVKVKIAAAWVAVVLTGSSLSAVAYRELTAQQTQARQAAPTPGVPEELRRNSDRLYALLRPLPGEYDWRDAIPWHTRIAPARIQAAREDKPLLVFSCANAFVLGRT